MSFIARYVYPYEDFFFVTVQQNDSDNKNTDNVVKTTQ